MTLVNSAILAAGTLAIALPIGSLLSILLTKFNVPGRRFAGAALVVLLLLPLFVQLTAWDAALGKLGWQTLLYGTMAEPFLAGMRGAIFIHGVAAIPWVAAIVGLGLMQVDPAQEEAARLVTSPSGVLWRITLPQARPFLLAAIIWAIVSTTSEMTVTNIYLIDPRQQTFTERFYMTLALVQGEWFSSVDLYVGLLLLAGSVGAAVWMVGRLSANHLALRHLRAGQGLGPNRLLITLVVWPLILVLLGVPILSLIIKAGFIVQHNEEGRFAAWSALACWRVVTAAPQRFSQECWDTMVVAAGAATWAVALGGIVGWVSRRGGWRASLGLILIAAAMSVPGPVVGAGLIETLNHDVPPRLAVGNGASKSWLLMLYDDTAFAPAVAQGIRAFPLITLLLWHSFATISRSVLEAAALDGLSPAQVFMRMALPQRWRAIAAAWLLGFAIAAGDLAWAHLVTPPGLDLLQRRVFGLVHSGVEEQVAAIGLLVMGMYGILAIGILWLVKPRASS